MRLHVDRPCQVCRQDDSKWGWQCALCPLPFRLVTSTAVDWRTAFDDADQHIRTNHTSEPALASVTAIHTGEPEYPLAA